MPHQLSQSKLVGLYTVKPALFPAIAHECRYAHSQKLFNTKLHSVGLTLRMLAGVRPWRRVPLRTRGQPRSRRAAARSGRRRGGAVRGRQGRPWGLLCAGGRATTHVRLGSATGGGGPCRGLRLGRPPAGAGGGPRRVRARPRRAGQVLGFSAPSCWPRAF